MLCGLFVKLFYNYKQYDNCSLGASAVIVLVKGLVDRKIVVI